MRGVVYSSWDGSYPEEARWRADLEYFRDLGVRWIQILTFAHQRRVNEPHIVSRSVSRWPKAFVAAARKAGFKILLKPHVWSREFYDGSKRWRGSIRMKSAEDWGRWFEAYEAFILQEATLAQAHGVEAFSIGLEYVEATRTEGRRWRGLIPRIRAVYSGLLTYSADGNHEAEHIEFWDLLDFIGINAYYALGTPVLPGGYDLDHGWAGALTRVQALHGKFHKPVVFTEAGYPSVVGATAHPWRWPSAQDSPDPLLQAHAYESLLRVWSSQPFFGGVFWWKFYERPEKGTPRDLDYTPRGKPAEAVLKRWYLSP